MARSRSCNNVTYKSINLTHSTAQGTIIFNTLRRRFCCFLLENMSLAEKLEKVATSDALSLEVAHPPVGFSHEAHNASVYQISAKLSNTWLSYWPFNKISQPALRGGFVLQFSRRWVRSNCNCNCNWGTCTGPPTSRPRAHHRINPYPAAVETKCNRNVFRLRRNEADNR